MHAVRYAFIELLGASGARHRFRAWSETNQPAMAGNSSWPSLVLTGSRFAHASVGQCRRVGFCFGDEGSVRERGHDRRRQSAGGASSWLEHLRTRRRVAYFGGVSTRQGQAYQTWTVDRSGRLAEPHRTEHDGRSPPPTEPEPTSIRAGEGRARHPPTRSDQSGQPAASTTIRSRHTVSTRPCSTATRSAIQASSRALIL